MLNSQLNRDIKSKIKFCFNITPKLLGGPDKIFTGGMACGPQVGNLYVKGSLISTSINVSPLCSRMLIAVVMMFAVCNLPQQVRIVWRHWGSNYDRTSDFSTLLTVSTFLISYMNSCLNPLLYAFLSRNFRKGMRELLHYRGGRRRRCSVLAMACTSGDHNRHENGVSTNLPQSSVVRLSSVQDSPCITQTINRQSIYCRNT